MFCQKCGKQIKDDTSFCTYCGHATNINEKKKSAMHSKNKDNKTKLFSNMLSSVLMDSKKLLVTGVGIIIVLIIIILALLIGGGKQEKKVDSNRDKKHTEEESPLNEIIGEWKMHTHVGSSSYAEVYKKCHYITVVPEGIKGMADIHPDGEEIIYYTVSASDVEAKEEDGVTYYYYVGEMETKDNNARTVHLDTKNRLHLNEYEELVNELFIPEDGYWQTVSEYRIEGKEYREKERKSTVREKDENIPDYIPGTYNSTTHKYDSVGLSDTGLATYYYDHGEAGSGMPIYTYTVKDGCVVINIDGEEKAFKIVDDAVTITLDGQTFIKDYEYSEEKTNNLGIVGDLIGGALNLIEDYDPSMEGVTEAAGYTRHNNNADVTDDTNSDDEVDENIGDMFDGAWHIEDDDTYYFELAGGKGRVYTYYGEEEDYDVTYTYDGKVLYMQTKYGTVEYYYYADKDILCRDYDGAEFNRN